jgi:hypothetical protein
LWTLLEQTHGAKQAARILAGVLGAMDDHGEAAVTAALAQALAGGTFGADGGNLLTLAPQSSRPVLLDNLVPVALRTVTVEAGCAADYDLLLAGGAS